MRVRTGDILLIVFLLAVVAVQVGTWPKPTTSLVAARETATTPAPVRHSETAHTPQAVAAGAGSLNCGFCIMDKFIPAPTKSWLIVYTRNDCPPCELMESYIRTHYLTRFNCTIRNITHQPSDYAIQTTPTLRLLRINPVTGLVTADRWYTGGFDPAKIDVFLKPPLPGD